MSGSGEIARARRIEGIDDAVVGFATLAPDEQNSVAVAVVDEDVRDASPCGEGGQVAFAHRVHVAIDPGEHLAFDDVNKFLLLLLRVRP